jgi:hypothetical protein
MFPFLSASLFLKKQWTFKSGQNGSKLPILVTLIGSKKVRICSREEHFQRVVHAGYHFVVGAMI